MRRSRFTDSQIMAVLKRAEVREHTERWLHDYNEEIPHNALDGLTPAEYRQFHNQETSSYAWT